MKDLTAAGNAAKISCWLWKTMSYKLHSYEPGEFERQRELKKQRDRLKGGSTSSPLPVKGDYACRNRRNVARAHY
jgi:hypothetical protein